MTWLWSFGQDRAGDWRGQIVAQSRGRRWKRREYLTTGHCSRWGKHGEDLAAGVRSSRRPKRGDKLVAVHRTQRRKRWNARCCCLAPGCCCHCCRGRVAGKCGDATTGRIAADGIVTHSRTQLRYERGVLPDRKEDGETVKIVYGLKASLTTKRWLMRMFRVSWWQSSVNRFRGVIYWQWPRLGVP
jgi:hypothetical protein